MIIIAMIVVTWLARSIYERACRGRPWKHGGEAEDGECDEEGETGPGGGTCHLNRRMGSRRRD